MTDPIRNEYDTANYVKMVELICKIRSNIFRLTGLLIKTAVCMTAVHWCLF